MSPEFLLFLIFLLLLVLTIKSRVWIYSSNF